MKTSHLDKVQIIMDNVMIISMQKQHSEDLANLFKALINLRLKISSHKFLFFRDYLTHSGPSFILKDCKPSYTPLKEKWDV